jgi:hypothetical protein
MIAVAPPLSTPMTSKVSLAELPVEMTAALELPT